MNKNQFNKAQELNKMINDYKIYRKNLCKKVHNQMELVLDKAEKIITTYQDAQASLPKGYQIELNYSGEPWDEFSLFVRIPRYGKEPFRHYIGFPKKYERFKSLRDQIVKRARSEHS